MGEIPEQQYKVLAKLPSGEFLRICRDLKEFGETMVVNASKEGIRFSVQGDIGTGNVLLKPRESEKAEESVSLTVHEPVNATFALRYLVTFSKAAPLCGTVELGLGPDAPLLVKFDVDKATMVTFSSIWLQRLMSRYAFRLDTQCTSHGVFRCTLR